MRRLDRLLQRWRIAKAVPWVRPGDRLLDVGCFDRSLLDRVAGRVASATGVDLEAEPCASGPVRVLRGRFPDDVPGPPGGLDCITMLAVLEHVGSPEAVGRACFELLAPGGRVVLTVPEPVVDRILDVLCWLRLADGMDVEGHHGYDVRRTAPVFESAGFTRRAHRRFQLGLNHLYVFEKPDALAPAEAPPAAARGA